MTIFSSEIKEELDNLAQSFLTKKGAILPEQEVKIEIKIIRSPLRGVNLESVHLEKIFQSLESHKDSSGRTYSRGTKLLKRFIENKKIKTIKELLESDPEVLFMTKGAGMATLREIYEAITKNGYDWPQMKEFIGT